MLIKMGNYISKIFSEKNIDVKKLRIRIPNHPTCNICGYYVSEEDLLKKGYDYYTKDIFCYYISNNYCYGKLKINNENEF